MHIPAVQRTVFAEKMNFKCAAQTYTHNYFILNASRRTRRAAFFARRVAFCRPWCSTCYIISTAHKTTTTHHNQQYRNQNVNWFLQANRKENAMSVIVSALGRNAIITNLTSHISPPNTNRKKQNTPNKTHLNTCAIVRASPLPDPHGIIPSGNSATTRSQSGRSNRPFTTSKKMPSPPTTTT